MTLTYWKYMSSTSCAYMCRWCRLTISKSIVRTLSDSLCSYRITWPATQETHCCTTTCYGQNRMLCSGVECHTPPTPPHPRAPGVLSQWPLTRSPRSPRSLLALALTAELFIKGRGKHRGAANFSMGLLAVLAVGRLLLKDKSRGYVQKRSATVSP